MYFLLKSVIILLGAASGFGAPSLNDRIVNGTDAVDGEFPFVVSIRNRHVGLHSCGGTIISPSWILTAAHCVMSNAGSYSVQYGSVRISSSGGNVATLAQVIVHENFNQFRGTENDIALLRLDWPLIMSSNVGEVQLPGFRQETAGGTPATTIGWGLDQTDGTVQSILQKVDYYIAEQYVCFGLHNITIYPSNICSHYPGGGKGQCNGDSGGPVLVNGQQVGIVSWSQKPCAQGPYPGVSTRVSYFIDWIKDNTGLELNNL